MLEPASTQPVNPLAKYFRQPIIHIQLPSGGKWWKKEDLSIPLTGELPVYSMTAGDEINFNTPDALMNGQAVVDVIHSCIPNIKNAWGMPSIDVDSVLIAIRIASYGEKMEYVSMCPHCKEQNNYELDLREYLTRPLNIGKYEQPFIYNELKFNLRPQTYHELNLINLKTFEQNKLFSIVRDSEMPEEDKLKRFQEVIRKLTDISVQGMASIIESVETADGLVVDNPIFIRDLIQNSDRNLFNEIKKMLEEISADVKPIEIPVICPEEPCGKPYNSPMSFDQSSFFG